MPVFTRYLLPSLAAVPVCFVLGLIIMVLILLNDVPTYSSRAIIELPPPTADMTRDAYDIIIETDLRRILSAEVKLALRDTLQRPVADIRELLVRANASPSRGTSLIVLTVESFDPVFAAEYANAWAHAAVEHLATHKDAEHKVLQRASPAAPAGLDMSGSLVRAGLFGALGGLGIAVLLATALTSRKRKRDDA
jgi:capsular polysaccharide biosynthesis protein